MPLPPRGCFMVEERSNMGWLRSMVHGRLRARERNGLGSRMRVRRTDSSCTGLSQLSKKSEIFKLTSRGTKRPCPHPVRLTNAGLLQRMSDAQSLVRDAIRHCSLGRLLSGARDTASGCPVSRSVCERLAGEQGRRIANTLADGNKHEWAAGGSLARIFSTQFIQPCHSAMVQIWF